MSLLESSGHQCLREVLADGGLATVERCRCGTIHLTLGALTLRLHEDGLASLSGTLGEAVTALSQSKSAHLRSSLLGPQARGAS